MDCWGEGDREGEIERGTHGEICVTSCPQPYLPRVQLPSLIYQESSCPAMQSKLSSFCIRKGSASSLESAAPASRAEREHRAEVECMRLGLQWPEPALSKKVGRKTYQFHFKMVIYEAHYELTRSLLGLYDDSVMTL